jgi:malonate decarboxylase alpha subunit
MSDLSRHEADRPSRLARAAAVCGTSGKLCPAERATQLLEAIIEPGDRLAIEGDNQKQADFLASALANVDPARIHDLHMVQSVLALPDHLAVFERGIANRLDFAYAGPQSRRLAELVASNAVKIGAIHTYLELYARTLVDLTPQVALVVADKADRDGNLYTLRIRPRSRKLPRSAAASSSRRSTRSWTTCRGSTYPATGSISSYRARSLT